MGILSVYFRWGFRRLSPKEQGRDKSCARRQMGAGNASGGRESRVLSGKYAMKRISYETDGKITAKSNQVTKFKQSALSVN